jgi:hypothetical protein
MIPWKSKNAPSIGGLKMMRRTHLIGIVVWLMVLLSVTAWAKKVAVFPDLLAPSEVQMDDNYIYITETFSIYIYRLTDFTLVRKFGKKGEGPGEFKLGDDNSVFLKIEKDRLLVNSVGRISYFSKEGEYQSERVNNAGFWLQPLGEHFAGIKRLYDEKNLRHRSVWVFNANLEEIGEVYKDEDGIQPKLKYIDAVSWPCQIFQAYEGKLYISGKDNNLYIFDSQGKQLSIIPLKYDRIRVTAEIKDTYLKFYRELSPYWRIRWERLKDWFRFPDYLPIVQYFLVADQKIYILTYKEENEKFQFLVLDINGKHLKTVFLPLYKEKDDVFGFTPFCIKNDILYQLIETEDEEWELHAAAVQ